MTTQPMTNFCIEVDGAAADAIGIRLGQGEWPQPYLALAPYITPTSP